MKLSIAYNEHGAGLVLTCKLDIEPNGCGPIKVSTIRRYHVSTLRCFHDIVLGPYKYTECLLESLLS